MKGAKDGIPWAQLMYMALDMGVSVQAFWQDFTPKGILMLVRQRVKRARGGKGEPTGEVRLGRIPR